jgi:hypothetical protein
MDSMLDPHKFAIRESVDGPDHPESTPLILALDVTGSMNVVIDSLARKGLKTVCEEVYKRRPIVDPHICICGIGDVEAGDTAPFQATQFESDIRIFEQLEKLFLEGGGGGNMHESYILAWYFAKFRTRVDCFAKRGRKGFIFTIGDEEITPGLSASAIQRAMGGEVLKGGSAQEMYDLIYPEWNVFHIVIREGNNGKFPPTKTSWDEVLGAQHVIPLDDHTKLGETIVSVLELSAGRSLRDVTASWDRSTGMVVGAALKDIEIAPASAKNLDAVL